MVTKEIVVPGDEETDELDGIEVSGNIEVGTFEVVVGKVDVVDNSGSVVALEAGVESNIEEAVVDSILLVTKVVVTAVAKRDARIAEELTTNGSIDVRDSVVEEGTDVKANVVFAAVDVELVVVEGENFVGTAGSVIEILGEVERIVDVLDVVEDVVSFETNSEALNFPNGN